MEMLEAFKQYSAEVRQREFPASEHTFTIPDNEWKVFLDGLEDAPSGG